MKRRGGFSIKKKKHVKVNQPGDPRSTDDQGRYKGKKKNAKQGNEKFKTNQKKTTAWDNSAYNL